MSNALLANREKKMVGCKPFLYQTAVIFPLQHTMTLYQIVKKVRKIHVIYWLFRTRAVKKYAKMLNLSLWGCSARCNENFDFPCLRKEHLEVNHFFLNR